MAFILSPAHSCRPVPLSNSAVHSLRPARPVLARARRAHIARVPRMSASVGSPVVDFALPVTGGATLSMADLFQKAKTVILYFYPRDATPGCTVEAGDFRDLLPQLEEMNATVVGVSRDSVDSHDTFSQELSLNFPLISDDGTLTEGYGVWKVRILGDFARVSRAGILPRGAAGGLRALLTFSSSFHFVRS